MNQNETVEQHALGQSLLLHLLPGVLTAGGYFALIPLFRQWGYPSMMAFMCAVVVILIPAELGYLLYQGKKKNGRFSLIGVVSYRVIDTDPAVLTVGSSIGCADGHYLYAAETCRCFPATKTLCLGSCVGQRLKCRVFEGSLDYHHHDVSNFRSGDCPYSGRVLFPGLFAAEDGIRRKVGSSISYFFIWPLSCLDTVDVPDAHAGHAAHHVCSAAEKFESGDHCPYLGQYVRRHHRSQFYYWDEQYGLSPLIIVGLGPARSMIGI